MSPFKKVIIQSFGHIYYLALNKHYAAFIEFSDCGFYQTCSVKLCI